MAELSPGYAKVVSELAARQQLVRIMKPAAVGPTVPVRSHLLASTAQTHPADRRR